MQVAEVYALRERSEELNILLCRPEFWLGRGAESESSASRVRLSSF